MKTLVAVILLLVLSISGVAQNLDGNWKSKISGPQGEMELTYNFKVDGETLSGIITSEFGEIPLENGKVNGKELSFDINIGGQVISHTGTQEGDIIKLNSSGGMEHQMELKRVIEGSKIDGKWVGKVESPQGEMELTFVFKVEDNKLTGKNSTPMGEIDFTNGVVNGDNFSFDVEMEGMKISHNCKYLADDSIEVTVNVMDQDMVMKLTRAE